MAIKRKLSWTDVANNVLLRLVSTGQLPVVLVTVVLVILIQRTPAGNISEVWHLLAELVDKHSGLGYGVGGASSAGWIIHTRYQRRRFESELERISEERNKSQQGHFDKRLGSSRKK